MWRRHSPWLALLFACTTLLALHLGARDHDSADSYDSVPECPRRPGPAASPPASIKQPTPQHVRTAATPLNRGNGAPLWQEGYGPFGPRRDAFSSMRNNMGGSTGAIDTHWLPRACIIGFHEADWAFFANMIVNTTVPFAIVRYGDGERMLAQGDSVSQSAQAFTEDKFWWEGGESEIGADMRRSLRGHYGQNYYYGFASPMDDTHGLLWFLQHTDQHCTFITYANLWVNAFYERTRAMLELLLAAQRDRIVLMANYEGIQKYLARTPVESQLPADRLFELPDDAAHVWQGARRLALKANATALARAHAGKTFLISGGPLAKVLIDIMWDAAPVNQYVDLGSATDEILKGRRTRPYMDATTRYAVQVDPPFWIHPNGVPSML